MKYKHRRPSVKGGTTFFKKSHSICQLMINEIKKRTRFPERYTIATYRREEFLGFTYSDRESPVPFLKFLLMTVFELNPPSNARDNNVKF